MCRSLALSASVAVALAFATSGRAAENEPKDIIAKAIEAHGGEEFLTKHKAAQSKNKGKITLPNIGEVDFEQESIIMLPDKFKETLELSVAGQKVTVVTLANGDNYSVEVNGKEIDGAVDKVKGALKDAQYLIKVVRLTALVNEKGYELSPVGEDKVDGKPVVGVRVSSKGHKDVNLYFDKTTGLLAKLEHQTTDAVSGNEIKEERIVGEYQKNKDGIPMPKKVTIKRDDKTFLEMEVLEAAFLEKLDDSEFKK